MATNENLTAEELDARLRAMSCEDLIGLLHFMNGYAPEGMAAALAAQERIIAARTGNAGGAQ